MATEHAIIPETMIQIAIMAARVEVEAMAMGSGEKIKGHRMQDPN